MRHEWCKSVLTGDYYGAKHPMRQTRTWELLAGGGKWHWILQLYSWPYYAMIIAGLVLAGFSAFLEKTERSSVFSGQSTDVAWYFPVFIDLGMQQPLSGLFYSGDDTDGIGWIDTGVEAAGGMEGKKIEREEQTGVFSRIEK